MHHRVDLDELARRLAPVMAERKKHADVGPLTWRDANAAWPQPITPDRASIDVPESLGLRINSQDQEIEVCVWRGGWADVIWIDGQEGGELCPEFNDVDVAYAAAVRTVEGLLA